MVGVVIKITCKEDTRAGEISSAPPPGLRDDPTNEAHLKDPEANVRERREGVVADVLTSGLLRVADKFTLLIVVDGLAADGRQHDPEDDEDGQPDLPHKGGVVGDLIQQTRQETPAHGASWTEKLIQLCWGKKKKKRKKYFTPFG